MNIIFGSVIIISTLLLLFSAPETVLGTFISGTEKGFSLTLKLAVVYAVWLGLFEILNKTGIAKRLAKMLKPINGLLFGKVDEKSNDFISLNMSANILGISGATTPMGIKAVSELEKHPDTHYAICMFFVINATSIQLIPSSVLALRISQNSASPSSVILPTLLTTLVSSVIGIILVKVFIKK